MRSSIVVSLAPRTPRVVTAMVAFVLASGCYRAASVPTDGATSDVDAGPFEDEATAFLRQRDDEICRRAIECEARGHGSTYGQYECLRPGSPPEHRLWREGTLHFDAELAAACLATLRAGHGCITREQRESCFVDVFWGDLPEGSPCGLWSECAPDLECEGCVCRPAPALGAPCTGTCSGGAVCDRHVCEPAPGPGTPCSSDLDCGERAPFCRSGVCSSDRAHVEGELCLDHDCGPDLACGFVDLTCGPLLLRGEPCIFGSDCVDGLSCVRDRCDDPLGPGEPCRSTYECGPDASSCVEGTCSSDPTGRSCRPEPVYGIEIDPQPTRDDLICPDGFACVPDADGSLRGTCARRVSFGAPCRAPEVCPESGRCVDGTCVRIVPPGASCGADAVCPGTHVCLSATCVARGRLGEGCSSARPCYEGACIDGSCAYRAAGEPCASSAECDRRSECSGGLCVPYATASLGEPCPGLVLCTDGTRCDYGLPEPICVAECPAL